MPISVRILTLSEQLPLYSGFLLCPGAFRFRFDPFHMSALDRVAKLANGVHEPTEQDQAGVSFAFQLIPQIVVSRRDAFSPIMLAVVADVDAHGLQHGIVAVITTLLVCRQDAIHWFALSSHVNLEI